MIQHNDEGYTYFSHHCTRDCYSLFSCCFNLQGHNHSIHKSNTFQRPLLSNGKQPERPARPKRPENCSRTKLTHRRPKSMVWNMEQPGYSIPSFFSIINALGFSGFVNLVKRFQWKVAKAKKVRKNPGLSQGPLITICNQRSLTELNHRRPKGQ